MTPIHFTHYAPGKPLILAVPVGNFANLQAPDENNEGEIHGRTVGWWRCRADGPDAKAVHAALSEGQRVFVMARAQGQIVRFYEVIPGCDSCQPGPFRDGNGQQFVLQDPQPPDLLFKGRPFAWAARHENTTRLRFQALWCVDHALRDARIVTDVMMGTSLTRCTFADLGEPRVRALLDAPSVQMPK